MTCRQSKSPALSRLTFEVTHSRGIDHGVRHGQSAPRRQGESTRAVVLVPSPSLLAQTLREWTANAERAFATSRFARMRRGWGRTRRVDDE